MTRTILFLEDEILQHRSHHRDHQLLQEQKWTPLLLFDVVVREPDHRHLYALFHGNLQCVLKLLLLNLLHNCLKYRLETVIVLIFFLLILQLHSSSNYLPCVMQINVVTKQQKQLCLIYQSYLIIFGTSSLNSNYKIYTNFLEVPLKCAHCRYSPKGQKFFG